MKKMDPKTRYKWSEITPIRREINPSETQLFSAICRGPISLHLFFVRVFMLSFCWDFPKQTLGFPPSRPRWDLNRRIPLFGASQIRSCWIWGGRKTPKARASCADKQMVRPKLYGKLIWARSSVKAIKHCRVRTFV